MTTRVLINWSKQGGWATGGSGYSAGYTAGYSSAGASTVDDVTGYVQVRDEPVQVEYGRDQLTAIAPTAAGSGRLTLDNQTRRFSPRNTTGPLYGKLRPARPVQISRSVSGGGGGLYSDLYSDFYNAGELETVLFTGHTDDQPISPDRETKTAGVGLVDNLADFRRHTISTPLYRGVRTGEAIGYVLDACGWTGPRDLDPGTTVIPFWWIDNEEALTALEKIVASEGSPALLTVSTDGGIVFRGRHHRLLRAASITSQQTWRNADEWGAGVEPIMADLVPDEGWSNIINAVSLTVEERRPQPLDVVWSSDDTIALRAGETIVIAASTSDPVYDARTPELDIDYNLIGGSVTVKLLRTSGASIPIQITANAAATITELRLRANPVTNSPGVLVEVRDESSIDEYGPRGLPNNDLPWCSPGYARAIATITVRERARPLEIATVEFKMGGTPAADARAALLLPRDMSDRVTIDEDETGLNADFYIERFEHTLTGDFDHVMRVGAEKAPAEFPNAAHAGTAIAGTSTAAIGLPDPATIAIAGSTVPGHRAGEGRAVL